MLYHVVFGTAALQQHQLDHIDPLVIPASLDTFAGIGKPPTVEGVFADSAADKFLAAWEATFPAKEAKREAQVMRPWRALCMSLLWLLSVMLL